MAFLLEGARAENLRGYTNSYMPLDRKTTVLVGRNNAGKTSLFKLLDWLLNQADSESLTPHLVLPDSVAALLLPARDTHNSARRLTLYVRVSHASSQKKFECHQGLASLRLNVRLTPHPFVYLALGKAKRTEKAKSTPRAMELLRRLRDETRFEYIPSFRDATSERFQRNLHGGLARRVEARAVHAARGGSPTEYRSMKTALTSMKKALLPLAQPLWENVRRHLPDAMSADGLFTFDCEVEDLVHFALRKLDVRLTTGPHDGKRVPLGETGSGLQSLVDIAVHTSEAAGEACSLLVVEEPESFLHPSAQRNVARALLRSDIAQALVVTTHSSVIVDEAKYPEVVICRDHRFYVPRAVSDPDRTAINSALMSGQGAEMLFARSVLLVEGESDRLFFENLRRRLASCDRTGGLDQLFVVAVGSKTSFAPWIRLIDSYGTASDRPIHWLIAADGDASGQVRRAFADAQVSIPQSVVDEFAAVGSKMAMGTALWASAVRKLNQLTGQDGVAAMLLPVDLESAILRGISPSARRLIAGRLGLSEATEEELLKHLGSKAVAGGSSDAEKAPWIRGFIGAHLPWKEVGTDIRSVCRRWMSPVFADDEIELLLESPVMAKSHLA